MPRHFNFAGDPIAATVQVAEHVSIHTHPDILEVSNSTVTLRLGDLPPSVLAAMWHDLELEGDTAFREALAQAFFDNIGEDVADYFDLMIARIQGAAQ